MRAQRGFSLIEVVVALGLFSVVIGMVFVFLEQTRRNMETESGNIETQQAARVALEDLAFHVRQAGYGIDRGDRVNPAAWQRAVVWAGSHALAFNADLDPARGALASSSTLTFPDGSHYAGEGPGSSTAGAETYYYTLDADGDARITATDHTGVRVGGHNPAADSENPLDYALFRQTLGYDGSGEGGPPIALAGSLFTNATAADSFPDGTSPEPLLAYWLAEDLDGDGVLAPGECVLAPCPPATPRAPEAYLWGDSNFDGRLSEAEKAELRSLPVGAAGWEPNPLAVGGHYAATTLAAVVHDGELTLAVGDARNFIPGAWIQLGSEAAAERRVIAKVDSASIPQRIELGAPVGRTHDIAEPVEALPETLLRAIRAVQVHFDAITPRADYDATLDQAVPGRAGRIGTRGLGYRVQPYERRLGLDNLRTRPLGTS